MINNCPHIKLTKEIIEFVSKFKSDEELLKSGGLPTNMLDYAAYGFSVNSVKTLMPKQLKIRWKDDLENVKYEIERQGLSDEEWAKYIDLSEPIDVEYWKDEDDGFEEGFYISDGHHRYYAAKILRKPLNVNLEIKINPITKLAPGLGYDDFHRCIFKQVKYDGGYKEISKNFLKQFEKNLTDKSAKEFIKGWINRDSQDKIILSKKEYFILKGIQRDGKIPKTSIDEIRKIVRIVLRENNDLTCLNKYSLTSDNIRYKYIKDAKENEPNNEQPNIKKLTDTFDGYDDLVFVGNRGNIIDYYEGFVSSCWQALFKKSEYKGLNKKQAIQKLVNERIKNIANDLDLTIGNVEFKNSILHITFLNNFNKINKEVIKERLMNVDDDVDYIYDKYFKDDVDKIKLTKMINNSMFKKHNFETSELKSSLSQKTNKLNPCIILVNGGSNYYNPKSKIISISVSYSALNFVLHEFDGDFKNAIDGLKKINHNKAKSLEKEFIESRIKGSIHHELAHWIDDTLHNQHIKKRAIKSLESGIGMIKRGLPINADKLEIQGQIHNVVQLKKEFANMWDELTFDDLLNLSPTLTTVNNELRGEIKSKWKMDLLNRMYREGLLGKKMIN